MSGFRPFVRQLAYQPGVQLNPLQDQTDGTMPDNSDQIVAAFIRLTRGRIDRPFRVNRSNFIRKTGAPEAMRVNTLNEGKLQVYEALENGAYEAVIQRLTPAAAQKSFAVVNFSGVPTATAETTDFTTATAAPSAGYSFYLMHHECHNDGIKVAFHAEQTPIGGVAVANAEVTVRLLDSKDVLLYEFAGSLDPAAKDDQGISKYLPDIAARDSNGNVEIVVAAGVSVPTTSDAYGRTSAGKPKWSTSALLQCFNEGGTTYTAEDYDRGIAALRDTNSPFGYLISGGTQVLTLLGKLASFAVEANLMFKYDVAGTLSAQAAVAFQQSLGFDTHYCHGYWAPLESEDPMNGGRAIWGAAGLNAGMSCARNARINAKGFAPKNEPVAGRKYALNRVGVRQMQRPTEQDESDLAKVHLNPVIFVNYNGGGRYVFNDSLTTAKSEVSYRKLIPTAEMSASLDNWVALQAKELLQLPMSQFVKQMGQFMEIVLADAQASQWLVPAKNLPGNAAFAFEIKPNEVRSADLVHINYWTSYDGVARQAHIQQTLVK